MMDFLLSLTFFERCCFMWLVLTYVVGFIFALWLTLREGL